MFQPNKTNKKKQERNLFSLQDKNADRRNRKMAIEKRNERRAAAANVELAANY